MLVNGSAEYYEIFTQENLWNWLQRIRHGYLPFLERDYDDYGNDFIFYWQWRMPK